MRDPERASPIAWKYLTVSAILALKLILLLHYGALTSDDTGNYLDVAHAILHEPNAFSAVPDWHSAALPRLAFRSYGYPLLIAGGQWLVGDGYGVLLVTCQILLSVVVTALLFDEALRIARNGALAAVATLLYGVSIAVLWDGTVMSDSFYAAAFNLVLLAIIRHYRRGQPFGLAAALALGALWGWSIWLRDNGVYFTIIPAAILCLPRFTGGVPRRVAQAGAFLLPVILMVGGYTAWNAYRTGESFFSMTGVANYLRPAFDIARRGGADPFDDGSPLSRLVKTTMADYHYPEQVLLLQRLHDVLGLSPLALQRLTFDKFVDTITRHPVAYGLYVADNLAPAHIGAVLFNPLASYNDFFQLGLPPHQRIIPGAGLNSFRDLAAKRDAGGLILAILSLVATVLATLAWLATLIGFPVLAWRERRRTGQFSLDTKVAALCYGTILIVIGLFALVHIEARHMLPVIPAGLLAAVYVASRLRRRGYSAA
ncbi:MAG TPA: hypothetical protein VNT30_17690 [Stellaceae bacterium]|nr:hypothetical protein [Stellaceae bacterium]